MQRLSLLSTFVSLLLISISYSQTTPAPTPDCDVFYITITSWNTSSEPSLDPTSWEGLYQLQDEILYGRPSWSIYNHPNTQLSWLGNNWILQNDDFDYITYSDSSYFPPLGDNEWTHGSADDNPFINLDCSDSFPPSNAPSNNPSYQPTNAPTDLPTMTPSRTPSYSPSIAPSGSPTQPPTFAPTDVCTVLLLNADTSTLYYDVTRRRLNNLDKKDTNTNTNIHRRLLQMNDTTTSMSPSDMPTDMPSDMPSDIPSDIPSGTPTYQPTTSPTVSTVYSMENWIFYDSGIVDNSRQVWQISTNTEINDNDRFLNTEIRFSSGDRWEIIIEDSLYGTTLVYYEYTGTQSLQPPINNEWVRSSSTDFESELCPLCNLEFITIDIQCFHTDYPSNAPSTSPTKDPTNEPSVIPTNGPTDNTNAPSIAPTISCDKLYLDVTNDNFENFDDYENLSNDTLSIISEFDGLYIKQNSLRNDRQWFLKDETKDIWIYYDDDEKKWLILNPTAIDSTKHTLYYDTQSYEPPIDSETSVYGEWWLTDQELEDADGFKSYQISLTCDVYTPEPTIMQTSTETPDITTEAPQPDTTTPSGTVGELGGENDDIFLGLSIIEWFFVVFILVIIVLITVMLCWYKEYKKQQVIEEENKYKLNVQKSQEEQIFGAQRKSTAPNSPDYKAVPNQIELAASSPHKLSYVEENDNNGNQNEQTPNDDAFSKALQAAASSPSGKTSALS